MLIANIHPISYRNTISSHLFVPKGKSSPRKHGVFALAGKRKSSPAQENPILPLKLSKTTLAQSALGVFALGFIDAGYSGDWSRIGVIPKESEDVLKIAAFFVVPLCLFIIFSFSKKTED
ncbi:unnamed protein product [Cuscuta epithymum]|uniref:DUF7887 domain-containing protein n=1 Tax=Cuscuta epithymum TaxID=186058 RepID=A0AAV0G4N7_9ASTE|nr:unnamed protein product [Cuscuta epithymum]